MEPESITPSPAGPPAISAAPAAPEADPTALAPVSWWKRIGGGSLTVSVVIHAVLILLAFLIVRTVVSNVPETVEFLPGGGGGGKGNEMNKAKKQRAAPVSAPKVRIVAPGMGSEITLPDLQTNLSDFTNLASAAAMAGVMGGGSGGLNGRGSGGTMGNGRGTGVGPGTLSGFVSISMIFGQKIDARRMAVVLDMSGSMYPFLPVVIKEVDKVAPGSIVVLHYGCGLANAEIERPGIESTSDKEFPEDRITTSLLESRNGAMNQQQREELLAMVRKRPKTYYVPSSGVGSTWVALTDSKLKDVDAIYWFADFADALSKEKMEDVGRKLRGRKQKLYVHPSNPKWLVGGDPLAVNVSKVESALVKPSGGKVLNVEVKKETPVKDNKPPAKPGA